MNTNKLVKMVLAVVVLVIISFLGYQYYATASLRNEQNRQIVVQKVNLPDEDDTIS